MCSSLIDVSIAKRWNKKIGIPDHFLYLFGHSIIVEILMKLQSMPMSVLLSRLCPLGLESLVYALMAGFSSLGRSGSTTLGAVVMAYIWPVKTKVPCDYSNLPWLVFFSHGIVPAITIPFVFLLIPSAHICDKLDINGRVILNEVEEEDLKKAESKGKRPTGASE
ncbi:unnamed protein product [Phytomonas sp. EM1]|nr:unnamed protein product [Phytomonas sp. EM1]|eukprot:CCW65736.1 unnamed protein product [Phytomonas sp. isolate EM1]